MDGKEITRTFNRIETLIAGVHTKLDDMPDWEDIDRQEKRRDAEQARQDALITAHDAKQTTAVSAVENKVTTLMFAIIGTALTAVAGVLRTL